MPFIKSKFHHFYETAVAFCMGDHETESFVKDINWKIIWARAERRGRCQKCHQNLKYLLRNTLFRDFFFGSTIWKCFCIFDNINDDQPRKIYWNIVSTLLFHSSLQSESKTIVQSTRFCKKSLIVSDGRPRRFRIWYRMGLIDDIILCLNNFHISYVIYMLSWSLDGECCNQEAKCNCAGALLTTEHHDAVVVFFCGSGRHECAGLLLIISYIPIITVMHSSWKICNLGLIRSTLMYEGTATDANITWTLVHHYCNNSRRNIVVIDKVSVYSGEYTPYRYICLLRVDIIINSSSILRGFQEWWVCDYMTWMTRLWPLSQIFSKITSNE